MIIFIKQTYEKFQMKNKYPWQFFDAFVYVGKTQNYILNILLIEKPKHLKHLSFRFHQKETPSIQSLKTKHQNPHHQAN